MPPAPLRSVLGAPAAPPPLAWSGAADDDAAWVDERCGWSRGAAWLDDDEAAVREAVEAGLGEAFEDDIVTDAVLAESGQQAANLWKVREGLPEAQSIEATVIKHDVSVPISRVPEYVVKGGALVSETIPGARLLPFGHLGDGNLHFNMLQPEDMERDAFLALRGDINRNLHDLAITMGGTFSAEHGVGLNKVGDLAHYRSDVEMDLMARVKKAFDPANIMNPGKVIDVN